MNARFTVRTDRLWAALLLTCGVCMQLPAQAQLTSSPNAAVRPHMQRGDAANMRDKAGKRQAELKTKLNITSAQETAWASYSAAMMPPSDWQPADGRAQRAELDKLPTPERIDKLRALRAERMGKMNARMDQRDTATRGLYVVLDAAQKKTFDAEPAPMRRGSRASGPDKAGHANPRHGLHREPSKG